MYLFVLVPVYLFPWILRRTVAQKIPVIVICAITLLKFHRNRGTKAFSIQMIVFHQLEDEKFQFVVNERICHFVMNIFVSVCTFIPFTPLNADRSFLKSTAVY